MTKEDFLFSVYDHVIFYLMLLGSALTGIYFGCGFHTRYFDVKAVESVTDYLHGNRQMDVFPVAMSLVASYVSGITVIATPTEIYNYGTQYWLIVFSILFSSIIVTFVYLPVFFKLQVSSSYEYLELRFHSSIRTLASIFFIIDEMIFVPFVMFIPSLAFNQVTGINLYLVGTIVTMICIFYTFLGGLKAVVWTDTWQIICMFVSTVVIVISGIIFAGGFSKIWETSAAGHRINFFKFTTSLYERQSFMAVMIGGTTYWTSFNSVNQTMVQRYLAVPTFVQSKLTMLIFTIGAMCYLSACCFTGLIVFTAYYHCDPLASNRITHMDQLLPLFVMESSGYLKGIPGLFVAGVFGAALSSLSVILNSVSTVVVEDFARGCLQTHLTDRQYAILAKVACLILGIGSLGLLYIVEHLGGILGSAAALSSVAAGATFGVFSLGILIPWCNTIGALAGGVSGLVIGFWAAIGAQVVVASNLIVKRHLPVLVDQCESMYNITTNYTNPTFPDESHIFPLYRISYHWIGPIVITTVLTVGTVTSFATGKTDLDQLNPDLISPISQWILRRHKRTVPTNEI